MKKEMKNTEITTFKLFAMILYFLTYERTYYDKKRGAFILEEIPKEDTYIYSCSCDDVGFYVVYMENGKNKTKTFLKYTDDYKKLSDIFNYHKPKEEPQNTTDYSIKHDKGKAKLLQVPASAIKAISEVMDYGASKYGANLWQRVEIERYLQATARHLFAVQEVDEQGRIFFNLNKKDEESGIEHLKHAICNLAFIIELQERNKGE